MLVVIWWFLKQRGPQDSEERISAIWKQRDGWSEETCRLLIERQLAPAMTPAMVRLAWGEPERIEPEGGGERWVYPNGFVQFEAGQVEHWSGSPASAELDIDPWVIIVALVGISGLVSVIAVGIILFASLR